MGRHISEVRGAPGLEDGGHDGLALVVVETLAGHHDHAAQLAVHIAHPVQELVLMKRPLGRVEQVGRVALLLPGQGGEAPALLLPPRDGLISPLLPHAAQEFGQLRLCRLPVPPDLDALPLLLGRRIAHRIQDRLIFHPVLPSVPGSAGTHM